MPARETRALDTGSDASLELLTWIFWKSDEKKK
jgi:hypothetical protein